MLIKIILFYKKRVGRQIKVEFISLMVNQIKLNLNLVIQENMKFGFIVVIKDMFLKIFLEDMS